MTSFLRQLTRQAAGQRLPGQPSPLRTPGATWPTITEPDPEAAERGLDSLREDAEEKSPASVSRNHTAAAPEREALVWPESVELEPPSPVRGTRQRAKEPETYTTRIDTRMKVLSPVPRLDAIEALLPAIVNPRRNPTEPDAEDSSHTRTDSTRSYDEIVQHSPPEAARDPVTESRLAPSPAARPRRETRTERAALTAAPTVPDVHIHIGRVELTALQPPAPRPAPRREEKKPMSLEEYLRQRDGRRS